MKFEQLLTHSTIPSAILKSIDPSAGLAFENTFKVEHIGADGTVLNTEGFKNAVVDSALLDILDTYFGATAKKAAWALGLINASGYTAVAQSDVMSSHAGWTELVTYAEATRPTWTAGAATGAASITGTAVQEFTFNAAGTVKGIFVTDNNTKGGTTGYMWSTALFSSDAVVADTEVFRVTYTLSIANT